MGIGIRLVPIFCIIMFGIHVFFSNFAAIPCLLTQEMKNRILILILTIVSFTCTVAQPYCDVHTFTIRDGLAANTISGFAQTKDDLMWISTWNGLCFYDGYRFITFRSEQGANEILSTNRIMIIKPSVTGDVWCCTSDRHAYLFDTKECKFINVSEMIKKKTGHELVVRNIYTLNNGHTWLASENNESNYRIDDNKIKDGEGIEEFSVAKHNLRSNNLKNIEMDNSGCEWIFGDNGTVLLNGRFRSNIPFEYLLQMGNTVYLASPNGKFCSYQKNQTSPKPVAIPAGVNQINSLAKLNAQTLLLATNIGVVVYNVNKRTSKVVSVQSPAQPSPIAISIDVDKKQRIWVYTGGQGITMIDSKTYATQWLMAKADNPNHQTTSERLFFHEDNYGTVWMVPLGGTFSYYNESAKRLEPYILKSEGRSDTYLPTITKFGFDKEKNLWFMGTRDVHLVNFKYHYFKYTPVLPNQEVRSLLVDSKGRTWAGTYNGQLAVFDTKRQLLGYLNKQGQIQASVAKFSNRIYALREDAKGRIWIGTKGDGLYILDNGKVNHFVNTPTDKFSISHNDIYDIDVDKRGHTWVAAYEGGLNLVDYNNGRIRFINHNNLMKQYPMDGFHKVRRITHDNKGAVYISTTGGLVTFSDNFAAPDKIRFYTSTHVVRDTTSLMGSDVLQTLVTHNGKILVVTLGGGIQRLNSGTPFRNNLKFCNLANIKPDEGIVQSIVEDNKGNIWIMREGSIDQYNLSTSKLFQYGPSNIGDDIELSEAKPAHNPRTDVIVVAARGGFITFNSKDLKKSDYKPNIVFTSVLYQGENAMESILNKDVLDVPSNRRNLTIYFSALEYSDKFLVKYAYMLKGVDDKWNYVDGANSASFNRLSAGHYKLLVKSTNTDGIWVDNVKELVIYVHPTFWETGWAKLLYFLLFCGALYLIFYIYNLRNKEKMERELGEMKTQFFTEISHRLRTPLTLIGGPVTEILKNGNLTGTALKHLEMVHRNALRMLELVNKMLKYSMDHGVYISDDNVTAQVIADDSQNTESDNIAVSNPNKNIRLLIVEDNDDLRAFLFTILSNEYIVLQAGNGQQGLEIAEKDMPDFIITDVMMPVMDGLTMVHKIKQNNDICHIPIIVLSAKASLEDRLHGLEEGIDDYITKPFSAMYLKSRVNNIINQRRMLQQTYVEQIKPEDNKTYKLESPQIVDADNDMMKQLLGYLEEHIGDTSLKIEDLADAVNLGRSVFYGKIKSIVGMSPVDLVRHIRIQRAEELITKSTYPFSQIAYMVGFSDPKYFSKCFKKETGMTPSDYREMKR